MAARILDKSDKLLIIEDRDNQTFFDKVDADGVKLMARGEGGVFKLYRGDNEELKNLGSATDITDPVTDDLEDMVEAVQLLIDNVVVSGNARLDIQSVSDSSIETTVSTSYVDVPDMTLTTKDVGEMADYQIYFNAYIENSTGTQMNVIINIDGLDDPDSEREADISNAGFGYFIGSQSDVSSITNGKVIKVRWKTTAGTATIIGRSLHIQGHPSSNIA